MSSAKKSRAEHESTTPTPPRTLTCPESSDLMVPHYYRVLSEEDNTAVVMHICSCQGCFQKVTTVQIAIDLDAQFRGAPFSPPVDLPPACLQTVRLVLQYLEHRLDAPARWQLDEHVASGCAHCANLINTIDSAFRTFAEVHRRLSQLRLPAPD